MRWRRAGSLMAVGLLLVSCTTVGAPQQATPPGTPVSSAASTPAATTSSSAPPSSSTPPSTVAPPIPVVGEPINLAGLPDEGVSGLAAAVGRDDVWFAVTDRHDSAHLLVLRADGTHGEIPVEGLSAWNLEALADGPCEPGGPRGCLFLADIGDNSLERDLIRVTAVAAPDPDALPASLPAQTWEYRYPDGAHDAEAMVVADDGRLVFITKESDDDPGHHVYVGPPGGGALEFRQTFDPPAPERPLHSLLVGTVVTDAAWDGMRMLVLTYDQVLEYRAPGAGADPADFPTWPVRELPGPRLVQTEGIAAAADGCGFTVVSEGRGGPVALAPVSC